MPGAIKILFTSEEDTNNTVEIYISGKAYQDSGWVPYVNVASLKSPEF